MVTKTVNQLHFEDLDPIRFEELILSMVYRMRRWEKLDHFGKKGSDDGIDIRAVEVLENGKENIYYFQCKRYKRILNSEIKDIIEDYLAKNNFIPQFYILVVSCPVSKKQIDYFESYCNKKGFNTVTVWTSSVIEAKLYSEYHDLLFAYFGVNLVSERKSLVEGIRRNIALKKRMTKDFIKPFELRTKEEKASRLDKPWAKFKYSEVLIRSIYDKSYPRNNSLLNNDFTGYYKAEVYDFYHNGLMVYAEPYIKKIKIQLESVDDTRIEEVKEVKAQVLGCIPFENIIDYDLDGDGYYNFPHLFCDFVNVSDPYEKIVYLTKEGYKIDDCIIINDI